jgi:ketosteroid isomerase-like protein
MRNLLALAALAATACATTSAPVDRSAAAEPVIAAERAFAARHQQVSVKRAFSEYAAPDGVLLTPSGARNARAFIATWPDDDDKGLIQWWPTLAGIARSGDLGFTTGPASFGGGSRYTNYFTVWKKQADGSWKWAIDVGTRKGVKPAGAPGEPVTVVPVSRLAPTDPTRAWADLRAAEDRLNEGLHGENADALVSLYAPEVHLLGWQEAPQTGRDAVIAMRRQGRLGGMKLEGGGVSAAGDLGWTYGFVTWREGETAKPGPFLRVWQRRAEGWQVLVENIHSF